MNMNNLWWGYIHVNKTIQVKRYFEPLDIQEANESPFVEQTFGPFEAKNREDAIDIILKKFIVEDFKNTGGTEPL